MAKSAKKRHPLFMDGGGRVPGLTYGMLRASFNGETNSTISYVAGKLLLKDPTATPWQGLASRQDTLIPADAPSLWWDCRSLWVAYEEARLAQQRDLALCFSVYLDGGRSPHVGWEAVRAWVAKELVGKRSIGATLIAHVPSAAGSSNAPHIHVIATARRLLPWGVGEFIAETNDEGIMQLGLHLARHRKEWSG